MNEAWEDVVGSVLVKLRSSTFQNKIISSTNVRKQVSFHTARLSPVYNNSDSYLQNLRQLLIS